MRDRSRLPALLLGAVLCAAGASSAWSQTDDARGVQRQDKAAPASRDSMPLSPGFPTPGGTHQGSANDRDRSMATPGGANPGATNDQNRSMATPPAANPAAAQTANPNNPDNMPVKKPKGTARGDDEMSHHDLPGNAVPK